MDTRKKEEIRDSAQLTKKNCLLRVIMDDGGDMIFLCFYGEYKNVWNECLSFFMVQFI